MSTNLTKIFFTIIISLFASGLEIAHAQQQLNCVITVEPTSCQGTVTNVNISVVIPNLNPPLLIPFNFSQTCGAGASLTSVDDTAVLSLTDPGVGKNVMCNVTASHSNPDFQAQCSADVIVQACQTDCSGQIITPTTPPQNIAVKDRCGVCNGDGQSCINCNTETQTGALFTLDGTSFQQKRIVQKAVKFLRKVTASNTGTDILNSAEELYTNNWVLTWSIPETTIDCNNNQFCSTLTSSSNVFDYDKNALELRDLAITTARQAKKKNKSTNKLARIRAKVITRRLIKRAKTTYALAIATSSSIDTTTDICT